MDGKGLNMMTNEFLAQIKADREREIRAAQRARLADRRLHDDEPDEGKGAPERATRSIGRPSVQPGWSDPSL